MNQPRSLIHPVQLQALARLARQAPPGHLVEVGVYRGGSAWHLAEVAREQGRQLHLFDTFCGTPTAGINDHHRIGDFGDISLETVRVAVGDDHVTYHPGVFPATLPTPFEGLAFVHVDCDQEAPIAAAIERLWPALVPGGVMLFDDYPYLQGARLAVGAHFSESELRWTLGDRAYAVKPAASSVATARPAGDR